MSAHAREDRVGQAYLIDHGSGRQSLRLVVGASSCHPARAWDVAYFEDGQVTVQETTELTVALWEKRDQQSSANVRRLA